MGKTHLIQRLGSKTTDIKHFKSLLPMDVKTVVEPFGGSFAVIRDCYAEDKYKKYVNDTDSALYFIYTNIDKLIDGLKKWNEIAVMEINCKEKKEKLHELGLDKNIEKYIIDNMIIRGIISKKKSMNFDDDLKIIKNINFSNNDAFEIIEKFRKDKNAFIFLDPPYLFSNNSSYEGQNKDMDNTDFYFKFLDILDDTKTKAKIMLVINDLKILRTLYKNYIKSDYNKTYQTSNKKTKHLIITNY